MTSDLDIYRTANLLKKQHGDETPINKALRTDEGRSAADLVRRDG